MTPQRVTLITLGVADLARSRAFYSELGWQPVAGSPDEVAFYRMDGSALALFGRDALAADQGRPVTALGTGAITLAQNFLDREAVDAAYEGALAAGATGLKAPEEASWGGYSGYWADLDGHVWEVAHNPFWHLDGNGRLTIPEADPA